MEYKIIISVLIIIIIFYFRFGPGSRLLKEKTHHYTVPPASRRDKNTVHIEIESSYYERFIIFKNVTESYLLKGIEEHGALSGNEDYKIYNFGLATHGDWKIIKVDASLSFYLYHNLAGWLSGYDHRSTNPELTFGFSKSKIDSKEDFLFFLDPYNEYGDTQVGAFRNGKSFVIYLPEAQEILGNLTIKKGIDVSMNERLHYFSQQGFNLSEIESLHYIDHKVRLSE